MRVLVTGGAGLVGSEMLRSVGGDHEVHATWRAAPLLAAATAHRLELRDAAAVDRLVAEVAPDVVVHTAYRRNRDDIVVASSNVARACAMAGAGLVHLSTDAVFDGASGPFDETDDPAPIDDYGRWKLEAERAVRAVVPDATITRTSLVVGTDPPDAATRRVLDAARSDDDRFVLFDDELRMPILVTDLVVELWALVQARRGDRAGVWHLPGAEVLSRHELGLRLCARAGVDGSSLRVGSQRSHPSPRPRDLTLVASRRSALGHAPRPI